MTWMNERCVSSDHVYLQHSVMFGTDDIIHSPYHSKQNLPHKQNKSVNVWIYRKVK